MDKFRVEVQKIGDIPPCLKVWFNGDIDKDAVNTYLNNLDSVDHANINVTDNFKYSAIIYPHKCWSDLNAVKENVEGCLTKFFCGK